MSANSITEQTAYWAEWWINKRIEKITEMNHETMAINPFLMPLMMGLHGFDSFSELGSFLLGGHLSVGHATGFGKLIDEKILPNVFGTTKLDEKFRVKNEPYSAAIFDEIDHIVQINGKRYLLSQKASKWTIQLTMAVQLNSQFKKIIDMIDEQRLDIEGIVVGVFYGKEADLTDKYAIVRGINRGANHNVYDLQNRVSVYSGKFFWDWISGGVEGAQELILDGLILGMEKALKNVDAKKIVKNFKENFEEQFKGDVGKDGAINWHNMY